MAEAIAERVRRYILDGSDEDLRRLLGVAEATREMARSAFRRVGMQEGMPSTAAAGRLAGLPLWRRWWARPAGWSVSTSASRPSSGPGRSWRRLSWATWSCLP